MGILRATVDNANANITIANHLLTVHHVPGAVFRAIHALALLILTETL